jgi:hypothetical protein
MMSSSTSDKAFKRAAANSTYKKLAVQWLNEVLCFVSSFVVAESLVLRNRQLLVAAKRCAQAWFRVFRFLPFTSDFDLCFNVIHKLRCLVLIGTVSVSYHKPPLEILNLLIVH